MWGCRRSERKGIWKTEEEREGDRKPREANRAL